MTHIRYASILLLWAINFSVQAETIAIGQFSQGTMTDWQEKSFVNHTQYSLITEDNKQVLRAITQNSASGLFKEIDVDLHKTPFLNWSWKITDTYVNNNEQNKEGDDYPARIYVVVSGGWQFWKTRALNYVWSSHQAIDTSWPNAYTRNAMMLAVESGNQLSNQWRYQKRNVLQDLKQLFGEEFHYINAVAIMSDSDNTNQNTTSYYGDIYFSAD